MEDAPRSPNGRPARLYVLTGLPGSGKSTYARTQLGRCVRVSLDDWRKMMSGQDYHPEYEPMVAEAARGRGFGLRLRGGPRR